MLIVRFQGGLGNQLFQYAMYLYLKSMGHRVLADLKHADNVGMEAERRFLLPTLGINLEQCSLIQRVICDNPVSKRCNGRIPMMPHVVYEETLWDREPNGIESESRIILLEGYWQNAEIPKKVAKQLKSNICFPSTQNEKFKEYLQKIKNDNSVSIHIRGGDYLKHQDIYGNICNEKYYSNAVLEISKYVKQPEFFVFTDDGEYAKNCLEKIGIDYTIVMLPQCLNEIYDLYLMSLCHHNIIANSTFSWWAAFLNSHLDKKVFVPSKWKNDRDVSQIYFDECIQIEV